MSLGITKDLAIATVRTYVQLIALGFVLRWVFGMNNPWLVVGMILLMVLFAAQIVVRRSPDAPRGIFGSAFVAMALTGFIVTFAVTGVIVQVKPWYLPQYVIPLAGMVLGNSMTGIALAIERVYADFDARADELLALTALGATPWEAAHGSVRDALRAGLIPTITSMAAAGPGLHPRHDGGPDPGGCRPCHRDRLPDRGDADGRGGNSARQPCRAAAHVSSPIHADGIFLEKGFRRET